MHKSRCVVDNIDAMDEECFLFLFQPQLLHDVLRSYRCTRQSVVSGPAVAAKGKNGITTNHESASSLPRKAYHLAKLASSWGRFRNHVSMLSFCSLTFYFRASHSLCNGNASLTSPWIRFSIHRLSLFAQYLWYTKALVFSSEGQCSLSRGVPASANASSS